MFLLVFIEWVHPAPGNRLLFTFHCRSFRKVYEIGPDTTVARPPQQSRLTWGRTRRARCWSSSLEQVEKASCRSRPVSKLAGPSHVHNSGGSGESTAPTWREVSKPVISAKDVGLHLPRLTRNWIKQGSPEAAIKVALQKSVDAELQAKYENAVVATDGSVDAIFSALTNEPRYRLLEFQDLSKRISRQRTTESIADFITQVDRELQEIYPAGPLRTAISNLILIDWVRSSL